MTLSTGRCPKWPIWQGELGQRTEDSQIIHIHNGHQYWKDDRWDCWQRLGFNFYPFFSCCRRPYRFSQSNLSAIRPKRRSHAFSNMWAKGGCSSDTNDKMNQAWDYNDCDINNDTIKKLGGHWHRKTKNTLREVVRQRRDIKPIKPCFQRVGMRTMSTFYLHYDGIKAKVRFLTLLKVSLGENFPFYVFK